MIRVVKFATSLALIMLFFAHTLGIIHIDIIGFLVLVLIFITWFPSSLPSLFKTIEVPGWIKVEFPQKLANVEQELKDAELLDTPGSEKDQKFLEEQSRDSLGLLINLRIQIEERLNKLAALNGINIPARRSAGQLSRILAQAEVISQSEASALSDLVGTLNQAAHQPKISQSAADWALEVGPSVLAALDNKIG